MHPKAPLDVSSGDGDGSGGSGGGGGGGGGGSTTASGSDGEIRFVHSHESCKEDAKRVALAVERTGGPAGHLDSEVQVHFMTQDVLAVDGGPSATAGKDYVAKAGVARFGPGQAFAEITVEINDDSAFEQDEVFEVVLVRVVESGGAVVRW